MRKNPIANVSLLFGPGRTFGKTNIVQVPPVVVPQRQSPRAAGPGNVHDPFGILSPRKPGSETPPGVQILAQGDHIVFARILFDAVNKLRQITVPFDIKSVRVYGLAGGAHCFTSASPKTDLDQFGAPLDASFIGTGLPNNDTIIPVPSIGAREVSFISAYSPPAAFTSTQQGDGPIHLYLLDDQPGSSIADIGSNPQDGSPNGGAGLQYQQPSLIAAAPDDVSIYFDASTAGNGINLPFYEPNNGGSFSIELVAYTMMQNGVSGIQSLFANGSPYEPGTVEGFNIAGPASSGTSPVFQFGCTAASGQQATAGSSQSIPFNSIYHIVATLDVVNQVATLYVNGVAGTSVHNFGQYISAQYPCCIGYNQRNNKTNFGGRMCNVAVYGYALNQSQVQAHYNALTGNATAKQQPQELFVWITDDVWSPSTSQIIIPAYPKAIPAPEAVPLKPLAKAIGVGVTSDTAISTTPGQLISVLVTALSGAPATMTIKDGQNGNIIGIIPSTATVNGVPYVFNMPVTNGVYVVGGAGNPAVTISYE